MNIKSFFLGLTSLTVIGATAFMSGCGGGGGSSSGSVLYYPYETLYGDVCSGYAPTPGCTFLRSTGERVDVSESADYDYYGFGADDLWLVEFNGSGTQADVYDEFGNYQYTTSVSTFDGWVGGSNIGVGVTGLFWEDVSFGVYWWDSNGVLYSANGFDTNYGRAINDASAGQGADTNFAALSSESNKALVKAGADKLVKDFGFNAEKATAVASALNRWGVAAAERGHTTTKDMDTTFKSVFGVKYTNALAAVKDLQKGNTAKMRDMTLRSASALGLKPHQAQKFYKSMYKKALANWGYDVESLNW